MNARGCALILVVILVGVLAYGVLHAGPVLQLPFPTFSLPTLGAINTLAPVITGPVLATKAGSPGAPTSQAGGTALPLATPTPLPPKNGRLLFLGFDQAIWSANPDGSNPVQLGYFADFHVFSANNWFSPDGRFILVVRKEAETLVSYLTDVEGIKSYRLAPIISEFDFGAPRDIFAFSQDSKKFFFLDASSNPASLMVFDLNGGANFKWPVQASADELTYATFSGGGSQLLIKAYDPAINGHYLELFDITSTLSNPRRVVELPGNKIYQFAVSPDGHQVAVVFRDKQDQVTTDHLYIVNLDKKEVRATFGQEGETILLTAPAWSPKSRFVEANVWSPAQPFNYSLVALDSQTNKAAKLVDNIASQVVGKPYSRIASFSPDGGVAGIFLYEEKPDSVAFIRALLDGSQSLKISEARLQDGYPVGEYVSAVANDWSHMLVISPQAGTPAGNLYSTWLDGNGRVYLDGPIPYRFFELGPVISPDSKQAAYLHVDLNKQQAELAIIDLDGKNLIVLFTGAIVEGDKSPAGIPLAWLPKLK